MVSKGKEAWINTQSMDLVRFQHLHSEIRKEYKGVVLGGNAWHTLCAFAGGVSVMSAFLLPLFVFHKMTMEVTAVEPFFNLGVLIAQRVSSLE